jgi:hypothetical protein
MKIGDGYFGEPNEKLIGKFDDEIAPLCGLFLMICLVTIRNLIHILKRKFNHQI